MAKFVNAKIFENPLPGIDARVKRVRVGTPLKDIVAECTAPMVCIVDGIPLKREYWMQRKVCSGDKIEFHAIYLGGGGGGGSRSILAIVATIALAYFAPMMVASWGGVFTQTGLAGMVAGGGLSIIGRIVASGIVLLGNALISAVIMPKPTGGANSTNQAERPSTLYSVDTQGNSAKIFSPIPVQYGRLKTYPCYAAQPYSEYVGANGDQYYYALFCVGQGEYDIEAIEIANTPWTSYHWVQFNVLQPGQQPTLVSGNMITSDAVSGFSLDSGVVGPFNTCAANRKVDQIAVDIIFPRGLYVMDSNGKAGQTSSSFEIEFREIDNFGREILYNSYKHTVSVTAGTITAQRKTFTFDVTPARYNVYVRRTGSAFDEKDTSKANSAQWTSLRARVAEPAPLCKTATHLELRMLASEQLSSLSQRKISVTATRKIKDFDGNLIVTRSPALALLDKWTNTVYGDGLPLSRVDIDTLKKYHNLCMARQDRLDYLFESRVTSNEADQLMARVFRAVVLQRNGTRTVIRDELADMPITLFNPQNTNEGSVSMDYIQITEETADGVIVEYFDRFLWDWVDIECPAPGFTYTSETAEGFNPALPRMENPVRITLDGITGWHQAKREGMYLAYTNTLRRKFISWDTELQGILVHYGAAVAFSGTLYNAGKGGEVADYREADGAIRLTGDITVGSKLVFMYGDGTMSPPLSFRSVGDGWIIVEGGVTNMNYADYATERTKYFVLEGQMAEHLVKITALEPRGIGNSGAPSYTLRGVVDVPEVHTCDEQWLPKPGEIQDVDQELPALENGIRLPERYDVLTQRATWPNSGYPATLVFYPDGRTTMKQYNLEKGVVEGTRNTITSNPAYINREIKPEWYTPITSNANYGLRAVVGFALPSGNGRQYARYVLNNGGNSPEANLIFQGIRFNMFLDSNGMIVMGVEKDPYNMKLKSHLSALYPGRTILISKDLSLRDALELKSVWEGFGAGLQTPVIEGAVMICPQINSNYTEYAIANFRMGMAHQM